MLCPAKLVLLAAAAGLVAVESGRSLVSGRGASPAAASVTVAASPLLEQSTAASTPRADGDPVPPVEDLVAAWSVARRWLDNLALPREQDANAAVVIRDAWGLSVIIRAGGEVVGRGDIAPFDGLALRRAMSRAMGEVLGSGLRSTIERSSEPIGPKLTLELEVCGEPIPLVGGTFMEAARRVRPGIDVLALRRGERFAAAYAGRVLATNTAGNIVGTFAGLAADLGLPARDLPELRRSDDVAAYRAPSVRLVQLRPGEAPQSLPRNDEYFPESGVTRENASLFVTAVAHRMIRATTKPSDVEEGTLFRGDYRVATDEFRPPLAPAFEQGLATLALLRFASSEAALAPLGEELSALVGEARNTAIKVLEELAEAPTGAAEPFDDPRAAAAAVLAILELPAEDRPAWLSQMLVWAIERMRERFDVERGFIGVEGRPLPPHAQSIMAAAIARTAAEQISMVSMVEAQAAVDAAWHSVPRSQRVALLPWIVWAERDLARVPNLPARSREPLFVLREELLAVQVGFDGDASNPDAMWARGGFVLTAPESTGPEAVANAQSLRPIAGLAAMLLDERLTPEPAVSGLFVRQKAGLRFVMQLTVRAPVDRLFRRPERALGGVREALWDADQPVAAQALALLALVDSLRAWPTEAPAAVEGAVPPGSRAEPAAEPEARPQPR